MIIDDIYEDQSIKHPPRATEPNKAGHNVSSKGHRKHPQWLTNVHIMILHVGCMNGE